MPSPAIRIFEAASFLVALGARPNPTDLHGLALPVDVNAGLAKGEPSGLVFPDKGGVHFASAVTGPNSGAWPRCPMCAFMRGRRLVLEDSKTGPRAVWLGVAARTIIDERRGGGDRTFAFDVGKASRETWLNEFWYRVRAEAGLPELRVHDLRHSYASKAVRGGDNLPTIGRLLGHADISSTSRYAHLDDSSAVCANEQIGKLIMTKLGVCAA